MNTFRLTILFKPREHLTKSDIEAEALRHWEKTLDEGDMVLEKVEEVPPVGEKLP